jgi:hypothetical protein
MKNADMPAMPAKVGAVMQTSSGMAIMPPTSYSGLTKREIMAMHALQGLLSGAVAAELVVGDERSFSETAVDYADALLAALEEKQ